MTTPNYSEMTDAALNEAAALAMGSDYCTEGGDRVVLCVKRKVGEDRNGMPIIEKRPLYTFDPANDHNHSAEFSAWFRSKEREFKRFWITNVLILSTMTGEETYYLNHALGKTVFYAEHAKRPRAETIATLKAFDAMAAKS